VPIKPPMPRRRLLLAVLVCLAAGCCGAGSAAAATPAMVRVGTAPVLPAGATLVGAVAAERPLNLYVALESRDPAGLEEFAEEVSTPGSPAYGQYLSVPEFAARFGAGASQLATVRSALLARGLQVGEPSANALSLPVGATAEEAEAAFGVSLERVRTADGRVAYANLGAPRVPAAAAPYVAGVIGLDDLDAPESAPVADTAAAAEPQASPLPAASTSVLTGGPQPCSAALQVRSGEGGYTADQIASAYDFSGFYSAGDFGAGQTVALLELEPFLPADVALYQSCYGTDATVETVNVEGGPEPYEAGDGAEAELDIEQLIGLAPEAKIVVYQGRNEASVPILSTFVAADTAKVMSSSWGLCEKYAGKAEMSALDTLLQEAAAQGQSFFVASGDAGSSDCYQSQGVVHDKTLQVDFPAGDPFATAVGGTQLETPTTTPQQYIWNDRLPEGAGGGGISTRFAMPSYQASANPALNVVGPLSSGTPCGHTGPCREVPDVSADAAPRTGYIVRAEEEWGVIGGTSAAAPLWAALATLTNASPDCAGRTIGFANPALYALAGSAYAGNFDDVVSSRSGLPKTTNLFSESQPYAAASYYDMATGLGAPVGATLGASLCGVSQVVESAASPSAATITPSITTPVSPVPPTAPTPRPHAASAHLTGYVKGRARLTLALEAGEGATLSTVAVTLPTGLVPSRRRQDLAAGIIVRDQAGRHLGVSATTYAGQTIRIRLASASPAVIVTLRSPALSATPKLLERVQSGRTRKLGVVVTTAEGGGGTARFPLSLAL
jgi:subtilase family serine protease